MQFNKYTRTIQTRSGLIRIEIDYFFDAAVLDFEPISDIELEYGYEDQEDLLTFYPNVLSLTFVDKSKRSYDILKSSISQYDNTLPAEMNKYSNVSIFRNNKLEYKGYIDPFTLDVSKPGKGKAYRVSFECICYSTQLKNISVDRSKCFYNPADGSEYGLNTATSLTLPVYCIFKQIFPDISQYIYDLNSINYVTSGIFFKHDWNFLGRKTLTDEKLSDWSILNNFVETLFIFDSMGFFGPDRHSISCADFLRTLALQFGMVIGVQEYGKVFLYKRFGMNDFPAIDITDKIADNKFSRTVHLHAMRGVIVNNHWNGMRSYEYGDVERSNIGEILYKDKVKVLDTYVGSYRDGGNTGTCIYIHPDYPVVDSVWDPQIGGQGTAGHCYEIIGRWTRENRLYPKERLENTLDGVDYNMANIYMFWDAPGNPVKFRPIVMKKSFVKNKTKITGLEI